MAYQDMGEEEEVFGAAISLEDDGYFGNYDDDSVEESDEFSSEERRRELGDSAIFDTSLSDLLKEITDAKKAGFFTILMQKKYRVVDADICEKFIREIRTLLPREIAEARKIIAAKDRIIAEANEHYEKVADEADDYNEEVCAKAEAYYSEQEKAGDDYHDAKVKAGDKYYDDRVDAGEDEYDRIVAEAEAEAERLVSETEIVRRANAEAERIKGEAIDFAERLVATANARIDEYIESVNKWSKDSMRSVYEYCVEALNKGIDISTQNATAFEQFLETTKREIRKTASDISEFTLN